MTTKTTTKKERYVLCVNSNNPKALITILTKKEHKKPRNNQDTIIATAKTKYQAQKCLIELIKTHYATYHNFDQFAEKYEAQHD